MDARTKRKCISSKGGRKETVVEEFAVIEQDGAELVHFAKERKKRKNAKEKSRKKKLTVLDKKDYTNFLKDYSKYDVFEPLIEPEEDAEARDGVLSNRDITNLLYKNVESNISTLGRIIDFKLNDIHNIRSTNILVDFCKEYHLDVNTLPLKRNEMKILAT